MIVSKKEFDEIVEELEMKPFFPASEPKRALLVIPFIGEHAERNAKQLGRLVGGTTLEGKKKTGATISKIVICYE